MNLRRWIDDLFTEKKDLCRDPKYWNIFSDNCNAINGEIGPVS